MHIDYILQGNTEVVQILNQTLGSMMTFPGILETPAFRQTWRR